MARAVRRRPRNRRRRMPTEPVVVVIGEGLVLAVPDRAWITIGAESRAPSPREAQRRNTELMSPVQQKLARCRDSR